MWDALFAIDPTLELVDMISIAMLLRIRWQLVAADTNEAFSLLLRYPVPDAPAYTFIKDALYLRDHLTAEGGAEIIRRYGKKAPVISPTLVGDDRRPSPSAPFVSSRTRHTVGSPRLFAPQQGASLESLLQNAAKGVLDRGSQWGVGKAIREAVVEVKKNVEAYQSGTPSGQSTPRSGGREFRKPARTGAKPILERTQSGPVMHKSDSLERRNKSLAKMLESAVGELWDYHKVVNEGVDGGKDAVEALSLAIAKVQFVQVYLEDSSIPLPVDETMVDTPGTASSAPLSRSPVVPERTASAPPVKGATPIVTPPSPEQMTWTANSGNLEDSSVHPSSKSPQQKAQQEQPQQPCSASTSASLAPRPRPLLSSPSFSWMLGQSELESETPRSAFAKASEHSSFASDEKRRMRGSLGKGYLFGDDEGVATSPVEERRGGKTAAGKKAGKKGKGQLEEGEVEEVVINLEDVEVGRKGVL